MAAVGDTVWAVDLGNNSLKALHLSVAGGVVQVIGFDNIQHDRILSGSNIKAAERQELTALSLREFAQRNELGKEDIVVSVPSQNSFARFVNLPPVEPKRIPEIVRFEAVQQIPFDINDVQWDWQLMTESDAAEKKVGIFAIKNEVVNSALEHFSREHLQVTHVQMAPMALYNYLLFDRPDLVKSDSRATVVINIGAENTDLVVCTKSAVWQRCILIGGNAFTKAIADSFKLNFDKAEKLKRKAPVSKYARQIFQAMRPVFTDLASEVQRSLGFYTSSNPNTKITGVIALGGGTKLRGLLKYLQQTLQIPVERPDAFKRLAMAPGVSAAKFHENVGDFGVVYGLALQGLGLAQIESNLLPRSIARSMAWATKGRYFTAAACLLLLVSLMCLGRTTLDKITYGKNDPVRQEVNQVLDAATQANNQVQTLKGKGTSYEAIIKKEFKPFEYREVIPELHETILSALPNAENTPGQKELHEAFANGDVEAVLQIPRKQRKQLFVTNVSVFFAKDLETAHFGSTAMMRRGARMRGSETEGMDEAYEAMYMEEMMMARMATQGRYAPPSFAGAGATEEAEKKAGFVVTVAGYSPYEDIGSLLDPAGVEAQPDKWGFVTRLMHLDEIVDGNNPFELYEKAKVEHFELKVGPVDLNAEMPAGIGELDVKLDRPGESPQAAAQNLIDPMTKEVISKVPELDKYGAPKLDRDNNPVYKTNDYWFVLNAKFVWADAPKEARPVQPTGYGTYGTPRRPTTQPPSSGTAQPSSKTKQRRLPDFGD